MFAPHQFGQIILSDIGILLWLGALTAWTYHAGFSQVARLYLVPYLW
jgi:omega-6 fatty acid desaturase (delta-12 desaturase)